MPRIGLMGGGFSSRQGRAGRRRGGPVRPDEDRKKKPLPLSTILRDAAELLRARRGRLALGFALLALSRLAGLVLPGTTKFLLDNVIGKGQRQLLLPIVLAAGAATLVQAITGYALSQVLGKAAQRSITEMRRAVQRHVGRLQVAFFDQTKTGVLLSRVMTDAEGIRNLVGTGLVELLGGLLTAALALGILFYFSVKLTLIALGVLSLFGLVLLFAFRTLRPLFRERSKINAEVSGRLTESFSGIRVVKAYRAERREALVFSRGAHRLFRNVAKTMTGFSAVSSFSTLLLGVVGVAIMWVGAHEIEAHRMTIGSFVSFTLYLGLLVGPVVQIVSIGSQVTEAFAGLERIRELRNEIAEDAGDASREPLERLDGRVEFRDVTFEYEKDLPVLRGISFESSPGTVTALVGPSGAGKSTIIGLVAAFYRPTGGSILVDGRDLSRVRLTDYRAQIGVVFQDNFLFDGSVYENIAYSRPDAPREAVLRAGAIARCDEFVEKLPEGYDTIVGERGVKLSGGQRQRVAIARAILADPRVLILDEATSSLDSESEALIQEGLAELMKGRTTFVIAHRLSTIRRADAILVIEDGRIVEQGSHDQLLTAGGRYAAMFTAQAARYRRAGSRIAGTSPRWGIR
jgi:ABC-type multidrug transport system fused ATPase/permease subunit